MRLTIGVKIFGIALGLLILTGAAAGLSLRMTHTVDDQLAIVDDNYFPAYVALAEANIDTVEESAFIRRLVLAYALAPEDAARKADLLQRADAAAKASDERIAATRHEINQQIGGPLGFNDNIALARLDAAVGQLQDERRRYEAIFAKLQIALRDHRDQAEALLADLDAVRDAFKQKIDAARAEMRRLASNAIRSTRAYQSRAIEISLILCVIAGLLGLTVAAAVTRGLVQPVHRLLAGTAAVEGGALDTAVPVTSRDEIGRLTQAFNSMVAELKKKDQVRETFGKYMDPRIVAGLVDRPELTDPRGARRDMTILFCDMRGFTSFSEGMTAVSLVTVLNRYLTVISDPIHRNDGIIDKYIGDAVMAFWGPPFNAAGEQGLLACRSAIEQLASLSAFQAELPELTGVRRGLPEIRIRVGIATGEVVVGSIGSEMTRSYTVIGDTVNLASRLEGACKAYGIHSLVNHETQRQTAGMIETREINSVLVVGRDEPERVYEILGRAGEVAADRLELSTVFAAALAAYRNSEWDNAAAGFEHCLEIAPGDPPSRVFLARIAHFREQPPASGWNGVWTLETK